MESVTFAQRHRTRCEAYSLRLLRNLLPPGHSAQCLEQIIRHAAQLVGVHEIESLPEVNTDNDEFRVMPICSVLAIKRDDPLVIINRAFRPKATDDSKCFHLLTTNRHE